MGIVLSSHPILRYNAHGLSLINGFESVVGRGSKSVRIDHSLEYHIEILLSEIPPISLSHQSAPTASGLGIVAFYHTEKLCPVLFTR